ncbi:PA14 domain-containing protein [Flammeovirga aprica]|uniref:T9SS type A sorting domain-containing protein n=1 Tax=Flammeovirga aprica JL-4 TaxID=694437 RepID=A0A7X9X9E5_9BACT|nr:PA14 domain-containing protein [Flammeovirga aprica]NME68787.1 T9SS type A sorting domain-containing protein [Flammeovirga aprica JL-4]
MILFTKLSNLRRYFKSFLLSIGLCLLASSLVHSNETITVSSMEELWATTTLSDQNVVMTPGTYVVDKTNMYSRPDEYKWGGTVIRVMGSNNTYDFTGVKIEVNFDAFFDNAPKAEIVNFHNTGNNNVFRNLEMEDIIADVEGLDCSVFGGALGVMYDGDDNLIEGFKLTIRGSYPYGYGDIFGKGGTCNQIGHCKHSGYLVRGNRNHLLNCELYSFAYGHGIFVQGGHDAVIEGCYIEGEVRTTDDIYDEIGTGSPADEVYQQWGYFRTANDCNENNNNEANPVEGFKELGLERGWRFSCQEDGIRAYNTGRVWDAERNVLSDSERKTENMTVLNCTVKNFRSGVVITHASGKKYAENCVSIGCETAYSMGSGMAVNCKGDATNGPLIVHEYSNDRNGYATLELLRSEVEEETGVYNNMLAWLSGSNHNISIKYAEGHEYTAEDAPDLDILVAGVRTGWRHVYGTRDYAVTNSIVRNYTHYPFVLGDKSSDNKYITWGELMDQGSNNIMLDGVPDTDCGGDVIAPITIENEEELIKGINYHYYEGAFVVLPEFETLTPKKSATIDAITLQVKDNAERFAFEFEGYFKVEEAGPYRFNLASSDGAKLYINEELVIDNSGRHDLVELDNTVCLEAGYYAVKIEYFQYQNIDFLSVTKEGLNDEGPQFIDFYAKEITEEDDDDDDDDDDGDKDKDDDGIVNSVFDQESYDNFVSPNPVAHQLNITVPAELLNQQIVLSVVDINGRTIEQTSFTGKEHTSIDMSDKTQGIYFIRLISNEKVYINRVIKK